MSVGRTVPVFVQEIIENIAEQNGFTDFVYHITDGSADGNGFPGLVTRIAIEGVKNSQYSLLSLICKYPPKDKLRNETFGIMERFEREVLAYKEILPEFENFQLGKELERNGDIGWWSIPKCYYAAYDEPNNKCLIVMEDLCDRNFHMANKRIPSTFHQTKIVLQELGKFHAVSFAMKFQKPELNTRYQELQDINIKTMKSDIMQEMLKENFENAKKSLKLPDDYEALMKFMNFYTNLLNIMEECVTPGAAEPYSILIHSDCWINNIMFNTHGVCLFDWQFMSYGSPAIDLMMYLMCSTDHKILETQFHDLIDAYYNEFAILLNIFGEDARTVFPHDILLSQLKFFGRHGLGMSLFAIPVLTNDIPELNDLVKNYSTTASIFEDGINDNFRLRMSGIIRVACKFGIL